MRVNRRVVQIVGSLQLEPHEAAAERVDLHFVHEPVAARAHHVDGKDEPPLLKRQLGRVDVAGVELLRQGPRVLERVQDRALDHGEGAESDEGPGRRVAKADDQSRLHRADLAGDEAGNQSEPERVARGDAGQKADEPRDRCIEGHNPLGEAQGRDPEEQEARVRAAEERAEQERSGPSFGRRRQRRLVSPIGGHAAAERAQRERAEGDEEEAARDADELRQEAAVEARRMEAEEREPSVGDVGGDDAGDEPEDRATPA